MDVGYPFWELLTRFDWLLSNPPSSALPGDHVVSEETRSGYDLCVVGGGPGGIVTALEFARLNPSKKIVLIEFGTSHDSHVNELDDKIVIETPKSLHSPSESTNKGLGGSSQTWGGRCVMYDPVDFMDRPLLGGQCTWGISLYEELKPYGDRAAEYFECGSAKFDYDELSGQSGKPISEGFLVGAVTDRRLERYSAPTDFGRRYASMLEPRCGIEVLRGHRVDQLLLDESESRVSAVVAERRQDGARVRVEASSFCIAAGAQETTRLLLSNDSLFGPEGPPWSLGRYYQGHISGKIASVVFAGNPRETEYDFLRDEGVYVRRRLQFTTEHLVKNNLLNIAFWLDNGLYHDPSHGNGTMSFMYLAMRSPILGRRLAPPALRWAFIKGGDRRIWPHIRNVLRGLPGSLVTPAWIFARRYFGRRKLPGVFLYNPKNRYALHYHSEQIPCEENRMFLEEGDLHVCLSLTEADIESVLQCHEDLDRELRLNGCGYLEYWYPKQDLAAAVRENFRDGIHQNGTTRIAPGREQGVVDVNLRVFGLSNLYVCSTSTFPTSSQANPTFLLGLFAVRLAEHLTDAAEWKKD